MAEIKPTGSGEGNTIRPVTPGSPPVTGNQGNQPRVSNSTDVFVSAPAQQQSDPRGPAFSIVRDFLRRRELASDVADSIERQTGTA